MDDTKWILNGYLISMIFIFNFMYFFIFRMLLWYTEKMKSRGDYLRPEYYQQSKLLLKSDPGKLL